MDIREIKKRISEYLKLNGQPYSDEDVERFVYNSAYNSLIAEVYKQTPFERMRSQQSAVEGKQEDNVPNSKPSGMLNKGISVVSK